MTTPTLFDVPPQARPGPGQNDVVLVDANKRKPKAHRPHPEDSKPWKSGPRPDAARRPRGDRSAYDGDRRQTACGWMLGYTRHYLLVQVDPSIPLCRSCWPVSKP